MTPLSALWLPIVLSAVIVFVASSIMHMVLPYHRSDYQKLPDEDKVLAGLRTAWRDSPPIHWPYCSTIGRSSPSSWMILAFSLASAMPAASTRMSAMLPGTRRNITKIRIDIPNSVRAINRRRRTRYAPISVALQLPPHVLRGERWKGRCRSMGPVYLSSQTSSKRQPL